MISSSDERRRFRCLPLFVGAVAACALALPLPPAAAHESEQYTLPVGRDFADLGPYFSNIFFDAIVGAVAEANTAISASIEGRQGAAPLSVLHSSDYIAGKVWEHMFASIPANELLDAQLLSQSVQSQYPGLVTMYRPVQSIYDDPLLVIDLTKVVRTFFRAGTVSAGGEVFGTDKLIHFLNIGRIYHSKYEARIARGLPEKEAIKSAIASTSRNFLTSEAGLLGMMSTGIHSNGDLAADYAGYLFYRNLTETIRVGNRTLPPMLAREGEFWRVQVQRNSDFLTAFITPHWNETLNPNKFARYTAGRIRTLVKERCADAIDWYRDTHGQKRGRTQFETIHLQLSTYFGADYGHEVNDKGAVTMAAVCFSDSDATAAATEAGSPDALGRSALWWTARSGDAAVIRRATISPGEINAADADGETPLHAATRAGSGAAVQELLARGADPNRAERYGVTPLMLAVAGGRTEIATILLANGANPNAQDLFGKTALHEAARRGNTPLTDALLKKGADPRLATDGGNTPLHDAARRGDASTVALLAQGGADLLARNAARETPRDVAYSHWHWTTAATLDQLAQRAAAQRGAGDVVSRTSAPDAGRAETDAAVSQ